MGKFQTHRCTSCYDCAQLKCDPSQKMNLSPFYEFCYDRQQAWYKKEVLKQPAPWSKDQILVKFKFCNIFRELDRGTKYILNRVINSNLSPETKFFNIFIYRIFNKDQLFDGFIWNDVLHPETFDFKKEEALLDKLKAEKSIFNDAYTITQTVSFPEYGKKGKHIQVLLSAEQLAKNIKKTVNYFQHVTDPFEQIDYLKSLPMVGPFLAGQLMLDLGYAGISKYSPNDWVVVGPGAAEGLRILFDKKDISYPNQVVLVNKLYAQQDLWFNELKIMKGKDWDIVRPAEFSELSRMNIQAALCEFRKYHNVKRSLSEPDFRCKLRYYKEAKL